MSAKPVNFKKRAVAGQCRAMRCKCKEPEHTLYEFETPDPKVGVALLCEGHWRRAEENKTAAPAGPAAHIMPDGQPTAAQVAAVEAQEAPPAAVETVETAAAPAPGVTMADLQTAHAATAPTQTTVVVEHGPLLAVVNPMRDEYTGMASALVGIVIASQEQVDMAGELLKQIKGKLKALEKQRKGITGPMLEAKANVDALFRPAIDAAKSVETILKKGLSAFIEQQQAAKLAAMNAGQHETALAVVQPELPSGVSTRTTWRFRITDMNLIPREYWVIDSAKVQAHVNAHKGQSAIPGVEVYCDTGIAASASS